MGCWETLAKRSHHPASGVTAAFPTKQARSGYECSHRMRACRGAAVSRLELPPFTKRRTLLHVCTLARQPLRFRPCPHGMTHGSRRWAGRGQTRSAR